MRIIVFLTPQSNKSLEKQQRDTLLSNRSEIEGLGIYFAKEPHRPQVTNSPVYIEVIIFCGSQPCFPSRKQRYYGLIELKPRTSRSKAFQNSTVLSVFLSKFNTHIRHYPIYTAVPVQSLKLIVLI